MHKALLTGCGRKLDRSGLKSLSLGPRNHVRDGEVVRCTVLRSAYLGVENRGPRKRMAMRLSPLITRVCCRVLRTIDIDEFVTRHRLPVREHRLPPRTCRKSRLRVRKSVSRLSALTGNSPRPVCRLSKEEISGATPIQTSEYGDTSVAQDEGAGCQVFRIVLDKVVVEGMRHGTVPPDRRQDH